MRLRTARAALAWDHFTLMAGQDDPLITDVNPVSLAPVASGAAGAFNTGFDPAERSRQPSLQARVSARWGEEESAGEIGVGIHRGRVLTQADTVELSSEAIAVSASCRSVASSSYAAKPSTASFSADSAAVASVSPSATPARPCAARRVGAANLRPNAMQALHAQWTPAGPVLVGLEWRRIATEYAAGTRRADHLNLALGFAF